MKLYMSILTADHWSAKNNLEKEAHQLAREMNHKLFTAEQKPDFMREFDTRIKALHDKYPRCKKLDFNHHAAMDKSGETWIYCNGVFHMSLVPVNEDRYTASVIETLDRMKDITKGIPGCTYGDTEYESVSVVHGMKEALDNVIAFLKK